MIKLDWTIPSFNKRERIISNSSKAHKIFPMISAMPKEFSATTNAWFLHDHLGSTVAVYGSSENGEGQLDLEHAYEYRSFGEMAEQASSADKVTENFTGKELDDETQVTYHGARYLDPMLGMWISVDLARFFTSPYLYMGNGYNPIRFVDLKGKAPGDPFGSAEEAAQDFARLYNGRIFVANAIGQLV